MQIQNYGSLRTINWTEIYRQKSPVLKGVCRRYVKDFSVADDMVQDSFEIAIRKIESYKGKGSFEGWLKRIAINQCLQFLRDQQKLHSTIREYKSITMVEMKMSQNKNVGKEFSFSQDQLLGVIDALPEQHKLGFGIIPLQNQKAIPQLKDGLCIVG